MPPRPDINLHFLWCVPRSISTAFEKMMANTGEFDDIFDSLVVSSKKRPVFVKDMGYHALAYLSDAQLKLAQHAFLIREPRLSIPSLYKMRPDFHKNETGFKGQHELFHKIHLATGKKALVIDAETLIQSPKSEVEKYFNYINMKMPSDILSWQVGARNDWIGRETWHLDAINSTGFEKPHRQDEAEKLPPRLEALIKENDYYYEQLLSQVQ